MAIIFEFPTDKQRARASIETVVKKYIDSVDYLSAGEKEEAVRAIIATYDQYSEWDIQASITPPADQPFTAEQITSINNGIQVVGDKFAEHIQMMFSEILKLRMKLFLNQLD